MHPVITKSSMAFERFRGWTALRTACPEGGLYAGRRLELPQAMQRVVLHNVPHNAVCTLSLARVVTLSLIRD